MVVSPTIWLEPQEIVHREFNSLRGRLLSVIEAIGLPEMQERALKQLVKQASFQQQKTVAELVESLNEHDMQFRYANNHLEKA